MMDPHLHPDTSTVIKGDTQIHNQRIEQPKRLPFHIKYAMSWTTTQINVLVNHRKNNEFRYLTIKHFRIPNDQTTRRLH